jgi:hypothetical protein
MRIGSGSPGTEPAFDAVTRPALVFLGQSLADLTARIAAIEAMAGGMAVGAPDIDVIVALQDLDRMRQETADLARFARTLSEGLARSPGVPAGRGALRRSLALGDLQDRFSAACASDGGDRPPVPEPETPRSAADAGEVLLYDPDRRRADR